MILQWNKNIVSLPPKMWGKISQKSFSWELGEQIFLGKYMAELFYMEVNDQIMPRAGEFHKWIFK